MSASDVVIGCRRGAKQFGHVQAQRHATVTVPADKVVALPGDAPMRLAGAISSFVNPVAIF